MGDNDFSVERTGVRVWQMAGTLERVVKYDAVAFQNTSRLFVELLSPEREQNMAFLGATVFFAAVGPCRVMSSKKKKKKTSKILKKHRRGHRTRARARINITPQT